MARSGRRPGGVDTRAQILAAARRQFTGNGYAGATIRGIATEAGVDPALVHHYFGTKDDLFAAALDIPVNPAAVLPDLLAQGMDGLGTRIVETMITMWDAAEVNPVLMVVRSLTEAGQSADMLREFITRNVIGPIVAAIEVQGEGERQRAGGRGDQGEGERQRAGGRGDQGEGEARLRATLAATQFVGVLMVRYVAVLEPVASLPAREIARFVGPNVQRYLTGDLRS